VIASGTGTMALFAARHFELKSFEVVENNRLRRNQTGTGKPDNGDDRNVASTNSGDTTAGDRATCSVLEPKEIDVEVVAVPCVGSDVHLLDQMRSLDLESGCHNIFPTVLRTQRDLRPTVGTGACSTIERNEAPSSKRAFGEPCAAHYLLWGALKNAMGMDFDLLYAPRTFELLLESFEHDGDLWKDCNILYYHCGGMEGNESQLGRYKYKKVITR
jgi:1-aminocyclopropane-1-carboxylate deaminase/D-cysteine desulfhydrase-like pyridoxal-dependent ACC family enzyme